MYMYIYVYTHIYCVMIILGIYVYTYIQTYTHIYICILIEICISPLYFMCVYVSISTRTESWKLWHTSINKENPRHCCALAIPALGKQHQADP